MFVFNKHQEACCVLDISGIFIAGLVQMWVFHLILQYFISGSFNKLCTKGAYGFWDISDRAPDIYPNVLQE